MDVFMKQSILKSFIVSLILTLVFLISPSSSFSNQETRVSTQKTQTYLKGEESTHQLVYIKKATPFILNRRLRRDHHRRLGYNHHHHHYYYYRHNLRRRGLHHRARYFKLKTKKNNGLNRPVRLDTFSFRLPKGLIPPSGLSPCHNQNPNPANTFSVMLPKGSVPPSGSSKCHNRNPNSGNTLSVMLPKGFVPPSGSSPCHNQNPNAATTLLCHLSTKP